MSLNFVTGWCLGLVLGLYVNNNEISKIENKLSNKSYKIQNYQKNIKLKKLKELKAEYQQFSSYYGIY